MSPATVPYDWVEASKDKQRDYFWDRSGSSGKEVARQFGLGSPEPVLRGLDGSGNANFYIFKSGGKFYVWNMIEDSVVHIASPPTLDGIVELLAKEEGSFKSFTLEDVSREA